MKLTKTSDKTDNHQKFDVLHRGELVAKISQRTEYVDTKPVGTRIVLTRREVKKWNLEFVGDFKKNALWANRSGLTKTECLRRIEVEVFGK